MEDVEKLIKFSQDTYRLMFLMRYNIYPTIHKENVSSHVAQVSLLTLYSYEILKDKYDLDLLKMLKIAIIHDLGEVNAIDIPHVIKEKNPELKYILSKAEEVEVEKLMGEEYKCLLKDFEMGSSLESIIVELCDVISCLIYSEEEIKLGNKYFERVRNESLVRLKEIQNILENKHVRK